MTSCQRKLRDIKYLKQRGKDLETIIDFLIKQIKEPKFPLLGLHGNTLLNDVNTGEFYRRYEYA